MATIVEQMRAYHKEYHHVIQREQIRDDCTRQIRYLTEQRDAGIAWARLHGQEFPNGARNNVAVSRSCNRDILHFQRWLRNNPSLMAEE